jgi:hypothetical protein
MNTTQQRPTVTKADIASGLNILKALASAVKELGEVPNGHLYQSVMSVMDIHAYNKAIDLLVRSTVILKQGDLLKWNTANDTKEGA